MKPPILAVLTLALAVNGGKIVGGLLIAGMAFMFSYGLTDIGSRAEKFKSYMACLCATYALSVFMAGVFGAPLEAGDFIEATHQTIQHDIPGMSWKEEVDLSHFIFWVSIAPAMIGVYCAHRASERDGRRRQVVAEKD
jgi:hypothetical protein